MKNYVIIPSEIKNITIAEQLIDEVSEKYNLGSYIYGNVLIAVIEAINNAIYHGNKEDKSKNVRLEYFIEDEFLFFLIKDQGEGFDFKTLPDPTLLENIEKINGRGLFLIRNLSDEVKFFENGTKLQIKFNMK